MKRYLRKMLVVFGFCLVTATAWAIFVPPPVFELPTAVNLRNFTGSVSVPSSDTSHLNAALDDSQGRYSLHMEMFPGEDGIVIRTYCEGEQKICKAIGSETECGDNYSAWCYKALDSIDLNPHTM